MDDSRIEIFGITPAGESYNFPPNCECTELCETDKLFIPNIKPNIKQILKAFVSVSISCHKIICTPAGKKLIINGYRTIKIIYTTDDPCNNADSVQFTVPFCTYILLKNNHDKITEIYASIEHVNISQIKCKCFYISIIIFICPIFKKIYKSDYCSTNTASNRHCKKNKEYNNYEDDYYYQYENSVVQYIKADNYEDIDYEDIELED